MTQYIALIQRNCKSAPTTEEWEAFFTAARQRGLFKGGSAIGNRLLIGDGPTARSTDHITGYMRFDSDDKQQLLDLLEQHPMVVHGGSLELCELPKS